MKIVFIELNSSKCFLWKNIHTGICDVGGCFLLNGDHMAKITEGICVISYWLTAGCGHTLGQLNNKPSRPPSRPSPSSPSWSTYITLSRRGLMNEQGSGLMSYFWILTCKSGHRWVDVYGQTYSGMLPWIRINILVALT